LTLSFQPYCVPGVDPASNRNEYQEYLLRVKGCWYVWLTNLLLSCANWLEILGASTTWNPKDWLRLSQDSFIHCQQVMWLSQSRDSFRLAYK